MPPVDRGHAASKKVLQGPQVPTPAVAGKAVAGKATVLSLDYLLVFLTRIAFWRYLGKLTSPIWRIVSMYWSLVSTGRKLLLDSKRLLFRGVGQLYRPCTGGLFRRLSYHFWLIRRWHVVTAAVLTVHLVHKAAQKLAEARSPIEREKRRLKKIKESAILYSDWSAAASTLDELEKSTMPQSKVEELHRQELHLYDSRLLEKHCQHLETVRENGLIHKMMFSLRADLLRNLGNMTNSKLHEHHPVVPGPIKRYIQEVNECLRTITAYEGPDVTLDEKLAFLRETRHAFGRTALVLSGGGALGAFHLGTIKALVENRLLPRVLAGSSVGSIISSLIGTRTEEELLHLFENLDTLDLSFFNNNSPGQLISHLVRKGTLQDVSVLQHRLKGLIGDYTFQDAYERTGRILNVCVCAADTNEPPRLLNYLTAPHAIIWSAVAASSAFPMLFHPTELLARNAKGEIVKYIGDWQSGTLEKEGDRPQSSRRWFDGSMEQDLPMRGLSEMFNVNYFLVSQANPHVVPLLYLKSKLNGTLADVVEAEWKHRCNQLRSLLRPDWFLTKVITLVSQTWEGDVTIVLPYEYCQVGKAIVNPTQASLVEAICAGQRRTWAKLAAIRCNCSIEATLDQCLGMVVAAEKLRRKDVHASAIASSRAAKSNAYYGIATSRPTIATKPPGRIPSWLMMSSLGGESGLARSQGGGSSESLADCAAINDEAERSDCGLPARSSSADSLLRRTPSGASIGSNPAVGLPCGGGSLGFEFPMYDPLKTPESAPFGSYTNAQEFWSRLLPVASMSQGSDGDALDFIAP